MQESWNPSKYFTLEYWKSHSGPFAKITRICLAAIQGFSVDNCAAMSSSLTYYTLLSIVPTLAVAFGIAKGFGFQEHLEAELMQKFLEQRDIVEKLIDFATKTLNSAQGGVIAGVGLAALFWSVLKLLNNIESSFNDIWKVRVPRSLSRKFSDYLAVTLFCPIFFAISSSVSIFIVTQIARYSQAHGTWETISPFVYLSFHVFPFFLAALLFTGLYYIMPNTRVPFKYALLGGVIAGIAYQILQYIYINFQLGLSSYGTIYGSFAAIPLFLLWLNGSWTITLIGAEIAYHAESDQSQIALTKAPRLHHGDGRVLGLMMMQECIRAFCDGSTPPTEYLLSEKTGAPVATIRHLLIQLVEAGLLSEITWKDGSGGHYHPGKDLSSITIKAICDALDYARHEKYMIVYDEDVKRYEEVLSSIDKIVEDDPHNYPLSKLLNMREKR